MSLSLKLRETENIWCDLLLIVLILCTFIFLFNSITFDSFQIFKICMRKIFYPAIPLNCCVPKGPPSFAGSEKILQSLHFRARPFLTLFQYFFKHTNLNMFLIDKKHKFRAKNETCVKNF